MELTRTAFGLWSGGRYMHFGNRLSEERFVETMRLAYDSGVRTFVTADVYGQGEADRMVARGLEGMPRGTYALVGAVGHDFYAGQRSGAKGFPRFTSPSLRGEGEFADYLRMATEHSLERCGADCFDLLLLHNPDSTGYRSEEVWKGMQALREDGLAASVGVAPGPANGFTLDLIECFERYGEVVDWAMVILNPMEPWPGGLCLPAAEKHGVKVLTRVVDCGGLFHDDVKPGHRFAEKDHRTYRPAGWVEAGCEKLEAMRPYAVRHGLTMLQLACAWNLAHDSVRCVVPTLIEEPEGKAIADKVRELGALPEATLTLEEVGEIRGIGDNTGCMALKGASVEHEGEPLPDRWIPDERHLEVAARWGIDPANDLTMLHPV